jgi:hypothetical protein
MRLIGLLGSGIIYITLATPIVSSKERCKMPVKQSIKNCAVFGVSVP